MSLKKYGVLKGKASNLLTATPGNEHFQILVDVGGSSHRIAINVKSTLAPPEVLFFMDHDYRHEITDVIGRANLEMGYTKLTSEPRGVAIDFIRRNMFAISDMRPIPYNQPGADNDLNEKLTFYVSQAINENSATVYAFGEKWGPENNKRDKYFQFEPGNGIHDIHMNQGNSGQYKKDNGVWQDGGLFLHFPDRDQWVVVFIAFQVQSFHTDDKTGNPLNNLPIDDPKQPEFKTPVRVIAAMVNPKDHDPGKEFVILLNKSNHSIDLSGWKILDKSKVQFDLIQNTLIGPAEAMRIPLSGHGAQLGNKGGFITLLNQEGLKVDGVSYTTKDADNEDELVEL